MSEPQFTPGPYTVSKFAKPLDEWSGVRYVIRAKTAPGGLAMMMGGLGEEEEAANARLHAAAVDMYMELVEAKMTTYQYERSLLAQGDENAAKIYTERYKSITKLLNKIDG